MLDRRTTHMLKQLLDTISETEVIAESHRQDLNRNHHFEPYSAFCRLDYDNWQQVSSQNLQTFFKENGLAGIAVGECAKVVKQFDGNNDGLLNYEDFCNMVVTNQDTSLRECVHRRPNSRAAKFERLPEPIEKAIVAILHLEVDLVKRVQLLLKDLRR
jgi:hypothetical protein